MSNSDPPSSRPSSPRPAPPRSKTERAEAGPRITGRSAPISEIGRELGELDFEPDEVLASLRPQEGPPESEPPDKHDLPRDPGPVETPSLQVPRPVAPRPQSVQQGPPPTTERTAKLGERPFPRDDRSTAAGRLIVPPQVTPRPSHVPLERTRPLGSQMPSARVSADLTAGSGDLRAKSGGPIGLAAFERHGDQTSESASPAPAQEHVDRPEPLGFENERPAAEFLANQGYQEVFDLVSARLDEQAAKTQDRALRARLAIVGSEVHAIRGQWDAAERSLAPAEEHRALGPIVALQSRQLTTRLGDPDALVVSLSAESDSHLPSEFRLHASLLLIDLMRVASAAQEDIESRREKTIRLAPSDLRPRLQRLVESLATSSSPPAIRLTGSDDAEPLLRAFRALCYLRASSDTELEDSEHPILDFVAARRRLNSGDIAGTCTVLERLAKVPGLGDAARWLVACLYSLSDSDRIKSVSVLHELQRTNNDPEVQRGLIERAVELRDMDLLRATLAADGETAESAQLSIADRLCVGAICGPDVVDLSKLLESAAKQPSLESLSAAVSAIIDSSIRVALAGNQESQRDVRLGCLLSRSDWATELTDETLAEYRETPDGAPIACALDMERYRSLERVLDLAAALERAAPVLIGERSRIPYLLALFREFGADRSSAMETLRAIDGNAVPGELTFRSLRRLDPQAEYASSLERLAEQMQDSGRSAPLLFEAVLAAAPGDRLRRSELLDRCHDRAEGWTWLTLLAEILALHDGNASEALEWICRRPPMLDDTLQEALDSVMSLTLSGTSSEPQGPFGLDAVLASHPTDIALFDLAERLAPTLVPPDWRHETLERLSLPLRGHFRAWCLVRSMSLPDPGELIDDARLVSEEMGGSVLDLWAERVASGSPVAQRLSERLEVRVGEEQNPDARLELYTRLVRLAADDHEKLHWHRAALETSPNHLPSLRELLRIFARQDRWRDLHDAAAQLARLLGRNERVSHAWLAVVTAIYSGNWSHTFELVSDVASSETPPLWSLRRLVSHARARHDDVVLLETTRRLADVATRALDAATLALRSAETAARLGAWDDALEQLKRAVELVPDHPVALSTRAEFLDNRGDSNEAADTYDALAQSSSVAFHKTAAWIQAVTLWMSPNGNRERAEFALEQTLDIDPHHQEAARLLQEIYASKGQFDRVLHLLERRLEGVETPTQKASLELERARAHLGLNDHSLARQALQTALSVVSDEPNALQLLAELAIEDADFSLAETTLLRLAQSTPMDGRRIAAYRQLAKLYEHQLDRPELAADACREILACDPHDPVAQHLTKVLVRLGKNDEALAFQRTLIRDARNPDEERSAMLELAQLYDDVAHDRRSAEEILEAARRKWPNDGAVVRALADFYRRGGDVAAVQVLLDRSASDARRALAAGRYEPAFFEVLATVAELREQGDAARVMRATLAAIEGSPSDILGIGLAASQSRFDEVLAPEVLTLPLRALLRHTGWALCEAYPIDLDALRAVPLAHVDPVLAGQLIVQASAFELDDLEILTSSLVDAVCIPARSRPPSIVIGKALVELSDGKVRDFLVLRALKILQANAAALSRAAPVDLWPMLGAYLRVFLPDWSPPGIDTGHLEEARERISSSLGALLDPDLSVLAIEVAGSIGNRASQLGQAVNQWGSRAALLALGDPGVALRAIAMSTGDGQQVAEAGPERTKWISRSEEARDLTVFGVGESYLLARSQGGVKA